MPKSLLRPASIRIVGIAIFLIIAFVIHSCKKDKINDAKATLIISDPLVISAKKWYDSTYDLANKSKLTTQSVSRQTHDLSKKFLPDWTKVSVFTRDGITYME